MLDRTVPPCQGTAIAADEGSDSGTWTTIRHDLADLDALDDENHARDALTEHYDLSWRDRDDG